MKLQEYLMGTGVALVTPFTSIGNVDYPALERLVQHVIENGVDYLVVLGTTAETPTLTLKEKIRIIETCKEINAGRLPLVVGADGNNTLELMTEINQLPLGAVHALLSACPYYNKPLQEGFYEHYKCIAASSPVPVILYNVPGRSGTNMTAETVLRLANEKNIIGVKEASGNMIHCMHILAKCPADFLVLSGDDHLALSQIALGMDGAISVAANCFPAEFSKMVKLCIKGDFDEASMHHYRLLPAFDLLFAENNSAGVKSFLAQQGLIENILRLPFVPSSPALQDKIRNYLAAYAEKQEVIIV